MKSLLKRIDFLGGNINIKYKGNLGPSSVFGGIITVLLLIVTALLILGFGSDFFNRTNPSLYVQDVNPLDYKQYNITNNNLPLSFRFENYRAEMMDPDQIYYFIDIFHSVFERNQEGVMALKSQEMLDYKLCEKNDYLENMRLFNEKNLKNTFCINYGNRNSLSFGGDWDGNFIHYISMYFVKCQEGGYNRKGIPCGTEEINKKLVSSYIFASVFVPIVLVDPSNLEAPLIRDMKNYYFPIDKDIVKNHILRFEETIISSDIGWIIESKTEQSIVSFNSVMSDYSLISSFQDDPYFKYVYGNTAIIMNKKYKKYVRTYEKIQTLAANVGGILKIFTFILIILNQLYSRYLLEFELINFIKEFYIENVNTQNLERIADNSKLNPKENIVVLKNNNLNNTSKYKVNYSTNLIANHTSNQIYNTKLSDNRPNEFKLLKRLTDAINQNFQWKFQVEKKMSFCQYLRAFGLKCCKANINYSYYKIHRKKLESLIDIREILSTSLKIDRFNSIIFTKDEEKSFYYSLKS